MDLFKVGIKFFMTDPHAIPVQDFIGVFQKWIQGQVIADHLLVDVHNYSHIHDGPGILLVAHEGNFSIDSADRRTGLLYQRKFPGGNPIKTARQACALLESDSSLKGRVRFRTDELQLIANDRLLAPNDDKTFAQLEPALASSLQPAFEGKRLKLTRTSQDPRERLTIHVQIS
jgi:hypothetical protein